MSFYRAIIFGLFCLAQNLFASVQALNESQVFEWWDDGIVSAEEAQEMLNLLQENNVHEACILAEIYALETCESEIFDLKSVKTQKSRKRVPKKEPALENKKSKDHERFKGSIIWKLQTDSLGETKKSSVNLQANFYRFNLRLGTQELLTYRYKNNEVYFGQISTKEFHSHIPLDTLWGTALFYPLGNFRIGAALDTAKNIQGSLNYTFNKTSVIGGAYWFSPQQQSLELQAKSPWGEISAWQIIAPNTKFSPLVKLELHNKKKQEFHSLSWKTVAYIHGDSVPLQSHLSTTLLKYKFWGSQNFNFVFPYFWNSKISANTRIAIPLEADTASTKVKFSLESGPEILRGSASVTCLEAENGCTQTDLRAKLTSNPFGNEFVANFSVKQQFIRNKDVSPPHWEIGGAYLRARENFAKISLVFPKGLPQNHIQIRNEVHLATQSYPQIQCNLVSSFEKKKDSRLHPVHGFLQINLGF